MPESGARPLFRPGLSANAIKSLAIVCMAIDHIAWAFFSMLSPAGIWMHALGRITAPCMCFFLAEGYAHTHSLKRYLLRLGIFALLSWPCYSFFESGQFRFQPGMIWSLFFSLLALWFWNRPSPTLRVCGVCICVLATLPGDWPLFSVVYTLLFWQTRQNPPRRLWGFLAVSLVFAAGSASSTGHAALFLPVFLLQLCVLLALPLLSSYNGARGSSRHPAFQKWFFYGFYPIHLLVLGFLHQALIP